MGLRLTLKGPQRLAGSVTDKVVDEGRIVIGRALDADWVLPDAQRVISKWHCIVERRSDGYHLTDTSTNGVLVNGVPVGHGGSRRLVHGDLLTIGDAIAEVIYEPDVVSQAPVAVPGLISSIELPADPPPVSMLDGPFGGAVTEVDAPVPHKVAVLESTTPSPAKTSVMQDWFIPNAGPKPAAVAEVVRGVSASSGETDRVGALAERASDVRSGGAESLATAVKDLDAAAVTRAVEAAVMVLPEGERERFLHQLRALLGKERPG